MKPGNRITYIANAGVLVDIGQTKYVIDGLCKSIMPIYKDTPDVYRERLINGLRPFNNIDIMFYTHHHSDHYNVDNTEDFIKNNNSTMIVATKKVKDSLKSIKEEMILDLDIPRGSHRDINIGNVRVKILSMKHEGKEYEDVQNYGYLIDVDGIKILHIGDALATSENYANIDLLNQDIDILIVPFPYVGKPSSRQIIEKYIKPKKIIALHMPKEELDEGNWISITKRSLNRVKDTFIETIFFEKLGDSLDL